MADEHGYIPYTHGCRCDTCREAKAAYMREKRARSARKRKLAAAGGGRHFVPQTQHGISGYQNHGCRCDDCCAAKSTAGMRESRRGGSDAE